MRSPFPFEFELEIERIFHSNRKKLKSEEQRAKVQEASSTMAGGGSDQRRILRDFVTPGVYDIASSIIKPKVEAYNFKLKPALTSMV